jgi:hypothetical protein
LLSVREQTIENFLAASNYLDHISPNELDQAFRSES